MSPRQLMVGRTEDLIVTLTNIGDGACTRIHVALDLPGGIGLLQGSELIDIPRLEVGQSAVHTMRVRPRHAGVCTLASGNISYRDTSGRSRRQAERRWDLTVAPAEPDCAAESPEPMVSLDPASLRHGEWGTLTGWVINNDRLGLRDVRVSVSGPLQCHPSWQILGDLLPGDRSALLVRVRVLEPGKTVPARMNVAYIDAEGRARRREHAVTLDVASVTTTDDPERGRRSAGLIRLLFLAADPTDEARLRLLEESREIQEEMERARLRDRFVLSQRGAVRAADVSRALLNVDPEIVHFSGHGTTTGALCFEDTGGKSHPIALEALGRMFSHVPSVRCVVLNACYSEAQARIIAEHVDYVVGMQREIGDQAAIQFSKGFYQAVGAGKTYDTAYHVGCTYLHMLGLPDHPTPVLHAKP